MQQLMYQHFGTLSLHSRDVFAEDKKTMKLKLAPVDSRVMLWRQNLLRNSLVVQQL